MITITLLLLPVALLAMMVYSKFFALNLPVTAGFAYSGKDEAPLADDTVESPKDTGSKPPVKPSRY